MSDWNSDPFSDRDPWFTVWRGGARRRPKSEDDANSCNDDLQPEAQLGPLAADEEAQARPISLFKKAGWVEAETKFKTMATLFAEFQIPQALKDRPVEFQLFRWKNGAYVFDSSAQGKPDASGRATVKVAIHKEYSEADTFRIQVRHGDSPWSNGRNTDRDVRETAEDVFDHKAVSGIHFPENSSFIVPAYLKTFRELDKAFTDWRRTHPNAKLVVFGHAERNEEDPRKLSERRAKIAFAFLTGDYSTWGRIAQEEKWGVWEQQHMLQAMGFYKGKTDGIRGPKTDKAILDFITWLNEAECKGINPMLRFTEEYIRLELYRVYISGSERAVSLPSGNFRTVSGHPYVGCTAFNRYHGGDGNHGENRRTTFLMLEESLSFPVTFPCRSTVGPCEAEAGKAGERAVKGFKCGFYDGLMRVEPMGEVVIGEEPYRIDWKFISSLEGSGVKKIYVPVDKSGNVLGVSGPTIATGFDLGQLNANGLRKYGIEESIEQKFLPYLGLQGEKAKKYVKEHPLELSETEIQHVDFKVKYRHASLAEAYFDKEVSDGNNFKKRCKEIQTVYASVFFQYSKKTMDIRGNLIDENYKDAVFTLLNYTGLTHKAVNQKTKQASHIMQYLSRRCQEARYLLAGIKDVSLMNECKQKVEARELEWESAYGKSKFW